MQKEMSELVDVMKDVYPKMRDIVISASSKVAKIYWELYSALIKKGFTKEQAMMIVVAKNPMHNLNANVK